MSCRLALLCLPGNDSCDDTGDSVEEEAIASDAPRSKCYTTAAVESPAVLLSDAPSAEALEAGKGRESGA